MVGKGQIYHNHIKAYSGYDIKGGIAMSKWEDIMFADFEKSKADEKAGVSWEHSNKGEDWDETLGAFFQSKAGKKEVGTVEK